MDKKFLAVRGFEPATPETPNAWRHHYIRQPPASSTMNERTMKGGRKQRKIRFLPPHHILVRSLTPLHVRQTLVSERTRITTRQRREKTRKQRKREERTSDSFPPSSFVFVRWRCWRLANAHGSPRVSGVAGSNPLTATIFLFLEKFFMAGFSWKMNFNTFITTFTAPKPHQDSKIQENL